VSSPATSLASVATSKQSSDGPKGSGWIFRTLFVLAIAGTVLGGAAGAVVYWQFARDLPEIVTVADYKPLTVTRVFGGDGVGNGKEEELLGEFSTQRRYLVPYDKIPPIVVNAFVAAEDDQFFHHPGINIASIIRAAIANFRAGHTVQGGSTITQQVAKSLLLSSKKEFSRKIKEIILASRFEKNLSKQDILYLYLNQIYLGHGAYGVQAAARTYFRKDIGALNTAEAAILAGLPQAPGKYTPLLEPKRAKERQTYVLRRMMENNFITQSEMNVAINTPVRVYGADEDLNTRFASYYVEHVRRYVQEKYGDKALYEDGLSISVPTTRALSLAAARSLRDGLKGVDKRQGYRGPLKRVRSSEMQEQLQELKLKLIEKKLGYLVFLPDGHLDALSAMKDAGIESELLLLEIGESYQALVLSVDDKKKEALVGFGNLHATLAMADLSWARPYKENMPSRGPEPTKPSQVLAAGDVVLVKYLGDQKVALDQEPQVQGAVFSMDVQTGFVLAMEGGYRFKKNKEGEGSEFNRAIQASRQMGSSYKPIIYAAGLEKGYTPATIIVDAPLVLDENSETGKWKPTNFEEKFYGDTTFRQALIKSRNVPTIKIVQTVQIPTLLDYSKRLGLTGQFSPDLSISLGSASVSLMDLTRVYALFPRLGRKVTPIFITKVSDRDGQVLEETQASTMPQEVKVAPVSWSSPKPNPSVTSSVVAAPVLQLPTYPLESDPDQVLDPRVAYVMTHLMTEVVTHGTGYAAKELGRPAAGKTGTTNDYNDAWFMGFTPNVVTGVWVGYDNQRTMGPGETGARAALPIWLTYMQEAVKPYPPSEFTVPSGVAFASIDPVTGKNAPSNSSRSIKEAFIEGTQPVEVSEGAGASTPHTQGDFFKEDVE
jgi:penicillin-binding protein 1A